MHLVCVCKMPVSSAPLMGAVRRCGGRVWRRAACLVPACLPRPSRRYTPRLDPHRASASRRGPFRVSRTHAMRPRTVASAPPAGADTPLNACGARARAGAIQVLKAGRCARACCGCAPPPDDAGRRHAALACAAAADAPAAAASAVGDIRLRVPGISASASASAAAAGLCREYPPPERRFGPPGVTSRLQQHRAGPGSVHSDGDMSRPRGGDASGPVTVSRSARSLCRYASSRPAAAAG